MYTHMARAKRNQHAGACHVAFKAALVVSWSRPAIRYPAIDGFATPVQLELAPLLAPIYPGTDVEDDTVAALRVPPPQWITRY